MGCVVKYTPIGTNEVIEFTEAEFVAFLAAGEYNKLINGVKELQGLPPIPISEQETQDLIDDIILSDAKQKGGKVKAFIYAMNNSTLTDEQKNKMNAELGLYYSTLTNEELISIGNDVIDAYGGLDKAIEAAEVASAKDMPTYIKVFIYGQKTLELKRIQEESNNEKEIDTAADLNNLYIDKIDNLLREAGRTIQFVKNLYNRSSLAVKKTIYKAIKQRNQGLEKEAKEISDEIYKQLNEELDLSNIAKEQLESLLNDKGAELEQVKKELNDLKKQIGRTINKTGNKHDLGVGDKKGKEQFDFLKNKLKKFNASNRDLIPIEPEEMQALTDVITNKLEQGLESFEDIYDTLNKELEGGYSDYYADAYKKARDLAKEKKAKIKFTPEDQVDKISNKKRVKTDAELLAEASAKEAEAEAQKALNNVKAKLSDKVSKQKFKERLSKLIPTSGNIWLTYQKSSVNNILNKLNAASKGGQSPLLAEFTKAVNKNIGEKIDELIPKGKNKQQNADAVFSLADIYKNQEKLAEIYEKALDKIRQENPNNTKAIQVLEKLLDDADLLKPFSKKTIQDAINQEIGDINKKLSAIVFDSSSIDDFKNNIIEKILSKANLYPSVQQEIKNMVSFELNNMISSFQAGKGRDTAKRIVNDAKTLSGFPSTKKESDLLTQLINKVAEKARDTMKSEKVSTFGKTPLEIMTFALSNAKKGLEIFNTAQKEVFELINKDTNLSNTQKEQLTRFLENYKNSIFENLLSVKDKNKILKEALIAKGYAKETANGNIVVDMDKVAFGGASVKDIVKGISDALKEQNQFSDTEIELLTDSLKRQLEQNIRDKKAAKVSAYIKSKKRLPSRGRKIRIEKLVQLYEAGGFKEKDVYEHLAKDLGIITFTKAEEDYVDNLLDKISKAPVGSALKAGYEEKLQAFFEHKEGTFALNAFFDQMQTNLLSSPLTIAKNFTGIETTVSEIFYRLLTTNIKALKRGGVKDLDAAVLKVVKKSLRQSLPQMLDIILNGGVDFGTAMTETTGQKEGTPSVRRIEKDFEQFRNKFIKDYFVTIKGKKINLNLFNAINYRTYYASRLIAAPDTFNNTLNFNVSAFAFAKNQLIRNNPNLTNKEASKQAFDMVFGVDKDEAVKQATQDFKKLGLVLDFDSKKDRAMFNRRVGEILQSKLPIEIVDKANKVAAVNTYKQTDWGLATTIGHAINWFFQHLTHTFPAKIEQIFKDSDLYLAKEISTKAAIISSRLIKAEYAPFIMGVANILEKGLEYVPYYGGAKGLYYGGVGTYYATLGKNKNNSKENVEEYLDRSGRYFFRAIQGYMIVSLLIAMADDDDKDLDENGIPRKKIYGAGDKNRNKNILIKEVNPENTITIGGLTIPFDWLGGFGVALKVKAAFMDIKRYYAEENLDVSQQLDIIFTTIIASSMTKGLDDFYSTIKNWNTDKSRGAFYKKISEAVTRAIVPFTSLFRAAEQFREPKAKKAITLLENFYRQGGIFTGFALNRPAYDILGNTYNYEDMYPNSARGVLNLFKPIKGKPIMEFMYKATGSDATISRLNSKEKAYLIINPQTGELEPVDDEQFYDIDFLKSKIFGRFMDEYYEKYKNREVTPDTKKIAIDDISNLNERSKQIAYSVMFKYADLEKRYRSSLQDFNERVEGRVLDKQAEKEKFDALKPSEDEIRLYEMKGMDYESLKFNELLPRLQKSKNAANTIDRWVELGIIPQTKQDDLEIAANEN